MQGLNREEAIALTANLTASANNLLIDLNYQGRTIVIVLHDLKQACRYADYLVAIAAGTALSTMGVVLLAFQSLFSSKHQLHTERLHKVN